MLAFFGFLSLHCIYCSCTMGAADATSLIPQLTSLAVHPSRERGCALDNARPHSQTWAQSRSPNQHGGSLPGACSGNICATPSKTPLWPFGTPSKPRLVSTNQGRRQACLYAYIPYGAWDTHTRSSYRLETAEHHQSDMHRPFSHPSDLGTARVCSTTVNAWQSLFKKQSPTRTIKQYE
jgi:hypothetical protein